jgi:hypothetical protein
LGGANVAVAGFAETTTDAEGNYRLDNLPAGLLVVQASRDGYASSSKTVDVLAGQTARLDFALEPILPLKITSVRAAGPELELKWEGGLPPYAVQSTADLGAPDWHTVLETSQQSALVPYGVKMEFFRIEQKP